MKKTIILSLLSLWLTGSLFAQEQSKLDLSACKNDTDSVSYAMGYYFGYILSREYQGVEKIVSLDIFQSAFSAGLSGEKRLVGEVEIDDFLVDFFERWKEQGYAETKAASEQFLEKNAKKQGIHVTESGLQYEIIRPGDEGGLKPGEYDDIVISYTGKTVDGDVFFKREERETYPAELSSALGEGTQLMSSGAKYIFYIPWGLESNYEYLELLEPYSVVILEVELLSVVPNRPAIRIAFPEADTISATHWEAVSESYGEAVEPTVWDAGDYTARRLANVRLDVSVEGYGEHDIVRSYEAGDFQIVMTEDRIVVFDREGKEVFRNTLDEESNSYDSYYLTEFVPDNGVGPVFLILDMGFSYGAYFGSMVYLIENGEFKQTEGFLNVIVGNPKDRDMYERLTPVLDLYQKQEHVLFRFESAVLKYNPAGIEILLPGTDFYYVYQNGKLQESGAALNLSYFGIRRLVGQFQEVHDYRVWHVEKGDVDGDGKDDLVVFVYENETIYVCEVDRGKLGKIREFDLPYDYFVNRLSRVLRGNAIHLTRTDSETEKVLVVRNGKLVEKD